MLEPGLLETELDGTHSEDCRTEVQMVGVGEACPSSQHPAAGSAWSRLQGAWGWRGLCASKPACSNCCSGCALPAACAVICVARVGQRLCLRSCDSGSLATGVPACL